MSARRLFIGIAILGSFALLAFNALRVTATHVTIDENLSVTPNVVSFETVFPGEVNLRPLSVNLSQAFLGNSIYDDVEYRIIQRTKPRIDGAAEREYCASHPGDYARCYPSLCPYLSKEPDNAPRNDAGVPAYHDPVATSSIAYGRLAKSDSDTEDNWSIDLHAPCFRGQCDQTNSVPPQYQLDPALNGQRFGCDLVIEVTNVSYAAAVTRTPGFWQTHTNFTSAVFAANFPSGMTVGTSTHARLVTNATGAAQSRLFGAYYSSIPKKTNNQNRSAVDKVRMQLLQHLVSAKLNCAAFGCAPATQTLVSSADAAYASGTASQMTTLAGQLDVYNNSGDAFPIPPSLGDPGAATPSVSQSRANKPFWDSP